jgi:hypothetical protein
MVLVFTDLLTIVMMSEGDCELRLQKRKTSFFRKTQALSYQKKSRKDKNKNACGLMAENRHTHPRK